MANTLMSLLIKLAMDSAEFAKGLNDAESKTSKSASQMGASLSKIGGSMQKVGGAMTLGVTTPIVTGMGLAVKAAMDSEAVMAEVEAVLKSTGGAAGVTKESLIEYANAMSQVTKFDDEAILSGQSMLLTFTNIGKDVFPEASTAMLNMAEKFGSMDSASTQLGKALNDPIAGVGALSRVGVTFSEEQQAMIKALMDTGNTAGAQSVIIAELNKEFGGLAEAAGSTTAGQLAIMQNQLGNLSEEFGVILMPILIEFMKALLPIIQGFIDMDPAGQKTILIVGGIFAAIGPLITIIGTVVSAIGTLITFFGAAGAGGTALAAVGTFLSGTVFPALAAIVTAIGAPFLLLIGAVLLLKVTWDKFGASAVNTITMVRDIIAAGFQKAIWWVDSLGGAFSGIARAMQGALDWVMHLQNQLLGLRLPDWLTPGSPTPFEMGLRGISKEMASLSKTQLPKFNAELDLNPGAAGSIAANISSTSDNSSAVPGTDYSGPTATEIGKAVAVAFMQMGLAN
jgi:hypothetical protein